MSYVLCDGQGNILNLLGVPMFDRKVSIVAMFCEESDALEVLYAIENMGGLPTKHVIRHIEDALTVSLIQGPSETHKEGK